MNKLKQTIFLTISITFLLTTLCFAQTATYTEIFSADLNDPLDPYYVSNLTEPEDPRSFFVQYPYLFFQISALDHLWLDC